MEFLPTVLVPGSLKIDTKDLKKKQFVLETEIEIILARRQQIFDKLLLTQLNDCEWYASLLL